MAEGVLSLLESRRMAMRTPEEAVSIPRTWQDHMSTMDDKTEKHRDAIKLDRISPVFKINTDDQFYKPDELLIRYTLLH